MRPAFAKAIDPIFLATLSFIERIERGERLVVADERAALLSGIEDAEVALGNTADWQLAKYALCAWIDALLIDAPWPGKGWWSDNGLVYKFFGHRTASEAFFQRSMEAAGLDGSEALEVYYMAVALGFRGFYANGDARYRADFANANGLPRTIEGWCRSTARSLQNSRSRPSIPKTLQEPGSTEPLTGRKVLLVNSMLAVALCGLAIGTALIVLQVVTGLLGIVTLVATLLVPGSAFLVLTTLRGRQRSAYPETYRIWQAGLQACAIQQIAITKVPLFLVLGARDQLQAQQLMKSSQLAVSVEVPTEADSDIYFFAGPDAIYLFLTGSSCISRVVRLATRQAAPGLNPDHALRIGQEAENGYREAGLADGAGGRSEPDRRCVSDGRVAEAGTSSQDRPSHLCQTAADASLNVRQRAKHLCQLLRIAREPYFPVSGIITLLPFELVEQASSLLQAAAEQDLTALRSELSVRCSNTVMITQLEQVAGFQEMATRLGEPRAREFRFGKGCEQWVAPEQDRLKATAVHAVGAFEDWIYMLFQSEDALKHRYNSRLFKLLSRARDNFAENLEAVLSQGFGFDPVAQPQMAHEQFWFRGCYFAALGSETNTDAFVKSVFFKGIQQAGELQWTSEALRRDKRCHLVARMFALLGIASMLAIIGSLVKALMAQ